MTVPAVKIIGEGEIYYPTRFAEGYEVAVILLARLDMDLRQMVGLNTLTRRTSCKLKIHLYPNDVRRIDLIFRGRRPNETAATAKCLQGVYRNILGVETKLVQCVCNEDVMIAVKRAAEKLTKR